MYVSSTPELTMVQNFLQHCYKRKYIYHVINIYYDVLEKTDCALFNKISNMPSHPLYPLIKIKESSARLRVPCSQLPRVNTQRFKNSSILYIKWQFNVNIVFKVPITPRKSFSESTPCTLNKIFLVLNVAFVSYRDLNLQNTN